MSGSPSSPHACLHLDGRDRQLLGQHALRRLAALGLSRHDHEDLVHDAVHVLLYRAPHLRSDYPQSRIQFVKRTIDLVAYDWLRKEARRPEMAPLEESHPTIEEQVDRLLLIRDLSRLLATVPYEQRQLFLALGLEELSPRELAERFGCSEPALRKRISRARRRLPDALRALQG